MELLLSSYEKYCSFKHSIEYFIWYSDTSASVFETSRPCLVFFFQLNFQYLKSSVSSSCLAILLPDSPFCCWLMSITLTFFFCDSFPVTCEATLLRSESWVCGSVWQNKLNNANLITLQPTNNYLTGTQFRVFRDCKKIASLYYHMRNFYNLIGLELWYFSLIWNNYMWKLQTFRG